MSFCSGILCTLVGLGKFGLLIHNIMLQGLALLDGGLELLLDLANLGLMLFACGSLLGRFVLGLGQRLVEGLYFGRCP